MDKRIIKTKKCIKEAFLTLRKKNDIDKIKVTDLCELAIINKTTFYKYYQDIYALSDEMDDEILDFVWGNFTDIGLLYEAPGRFLKGLYAVFEAHREEVLALFGDRMNVLVGKVEQRLREHYLTTSSSPKEDITLSFLIGGATHIVMNPKYEKDAVIKVAVDIISKVIHD
jgi:AcrR family transcriptional regulator